MTSLNWKNLNVLITGGSLGLGRETAIALADRHANVAVVARNAEHLAALKNKAPSIHTIQADVADKNQIHRIYAEAGQKVGDVDVLINNASTLGPVPLRMLIDTDCEDFSSALETNLLAPFRLSKLVLPSMLLKRKGVIVNISSDAAVQNYPTWGAYSVSKSALDHMTAIFETELETKLENSGVHFMAVDPGDMATALHFAALPGADVSKLRKPEEAAQMLIAKIESGSFSAAHSRLV